MKVHIPNQGSKFISAGIVLFTKREVKLQAYNDLPWRYSHKYIIHVFIFIINHRK